MTDPTSRQRGRRTETRQQRSENNHRTQNNIWSQVLEWARHLDILTDWLTVSCKVTSTSVSEELVTFSLRILYNVGRQNDGRLIGKYLDGSDSFLIEVLPRNLPRRSEKTYQDILVQAQIEIEHLMNVSWKSSGLRELGRRDQVNLPKLLLRKQQSWNGFKICKGNKMLDGGVG
jgi:hypothetical protein